MAQPNDEVVSLLNDLVRTCEDGMSGFRLAADAVRNPDAQSLFRSRIQNIDRATTQLQDAVRRLGGDPTDRGHAAAPIHRGWINIKAVVTGHDDDAIIAEVVRGEEYAVQHYGEALEKDLPPDVRMIVERQARGVEDNLEMVRNLRRGTGLGTTQSTRAVEPRPAI
jgi:uncharacterized protein (TIGR02284 family)